MRSVGRETYRPRSHLRVVCFVGGANCGSHTTSPSRSTGRIRITASCARSGERVGSGFDLAGIAITLAVSVAA